MAGLWWAPWDAVKAGPGSPRDSFAYFLPIYISVGGKKSHHLLNQYIHLIPFPIKLKPRDLKLYFTFHNSLYF